MSAAILSILWQISWHAAIATAVVLVVRAVVGRAVPGRWRHALWVVVLCRLVMPIAPHSRASVFNLWRPADRPPTSTVVAPTVRWSVEADPAEAPPVAAPPAEVPPAPPPRRWPAVVTGVWLAVALALVARLVVVNVRFQRQLARTGHPAGDVLRTAFDAGRREMGGGRATLVLTDAVATPAVCGVLRPQVLVPSALAHAMTADRARLVFLHELAHVRCHDVLVDWAWAIVRSAYWFNPVVWLVGPMRRHDREVARDEMVLAVIGDAAAEAYGRMLLDLARPGARPAMGVGLVGLFDGRGLSDRVRRVARPRRGSAWVGAAVLVAAGCAALTNPQQRPATAPAPVAATQPADVDPDAPSPATAATLDRLDRRLPQLRFNANKLSDVLDYLRDTTGVNLYVDWPAVTAAGIARDAPVTARLRDIKFSKALALIFKCVEGDDYDHQLGYVVDDGTITISTRRELGKNVVTRRYDINDLLFVPADDRAATGPKTDAARASVRQQRIEEIKRYIEQNVDPYSWADNTDYADRLGPGRISTSRLRAIFLVTATPENHRKVRAVLSALRASQGLQVSVELRVLFVPGDDWPKLPADVRRLLGDGQPLPDHGTLLSTVDAANVVETTTRSPISMGPPGPPRLTMFSGEQTSLNVKTEQAYLAAYTPVVRPGGGGTAYEPVVRTTTSSGLTHDLRATVSPDRQHVFVDLRSTVQRLAGLVSEPWAGAPAVGLKVQRPVTLTSETHVNCSIADGTTLLVPCGSVAPSTGDPPFHDPAVAAEVDRARRGHLYLLVRAVAIVEGDRVTPPTDLRRAVTWP